MEELLHSYGYLAVLVGTFLEGETVLVLGGLAAHLGYLELKWVIALAFVGAFAGDQLWFFLGRRYGQAVLARVPTWRERVDRVHAMLGSYELAVLLGFRFAYGVRSLTAFVVGLTRISARKFMICNAIAALIWSVTIACVGYLFGRTVDLVLDLERYQLWVIVAIALMGIALGVVQRARRRRSRAS